MVVDLVLDGPELVAHRLGQLGEIGGVDLHPRQLHPGKDGGQRELQVDQQRSNEEKRADLLVNQVGVLPEPAKSSAASKIPLENRAGVDVCLTGNGISELRLEPVMQLLELRNHDLMIVVSAGVARDGSAWLTTAITQRDDDSALRSLER